MACEHDHLLMDVMEKGFALDDALLYLDTHLTDAAAQKFYQAHQAAYREAVCAYVRHIGPLQLDDIPNTECSAWVNTPWPWEMEA